MTEEPNVLPEGTKASGRWPHAIFNSGFTFSRRRFEDTVWLTSIGYLLLPYFLFGMFWLRPIVALPFLGVIGVSAALTVKAFLRRPADTDTFFIAWFELVAIPLVILWLILSGTGGYFSQCSDFHRTNACLRDLAYYNWPVTYYGASKTLVYYVGNYLPAAGFGKLFGFKAMEAFFFAWTLVSCVLGICWLCLLARARLLPACFMLMFFSGLDWLGAIVCGAPIDGSRHLGWWVASFAPLQYGCNTTFLFYSHSHIIVAWVLSSMVLRELLSKQPVPGSTGFYFGLSMLLSPLIGVGLFPFAILAALRNPKREFTFANLICAPMIGVLMFLFYRAGFLGSPSGKEYNGPLWKFVSLTNAWPGILLFYLMEFGALVYCISEFIWKTNDGWMQATLVCLTGVLLLCPFYRLGLGNDFVLRVSVPAFFALQVLTLFFLSKGTLSRYQVARRVTMVILLIGVLNAGNEISRMSAGPKVRADGWQTLINSPYADQYLSKLEPFFARVLARKGRPPGHDWKTFPLTDGKWINGIAVDGKSILLPRSIETVNFETGDEVVFAHSGPRTITSTAVDENWFYVSFEGPLDPQSDGFPHAFLHVAKDSR